MKKLLFLSFLIFFIVGCSEFTKTNEVKELSPIELLNDDESLAFEIFINFVNDNNFFNPSQVRILSVEKIRAIYYLNNPVRFYLVYKIQASNRIGGTVTKIYQFQLDENNKVLSFFELSGNTKINKGLSIGKINIAINHYWTELGLG